MPLGNPIRKQNESRMVSVLATEGQTVFTVQGGYIINQISVFRNGVRLSPAEDFTAGDGSTVTLNNAANIDDRIDFHIFDRFTVQNAIIGAASTQTINGDLVLNGKLFGALDVPSINLTGIITATELDINGKGDISGDLNVTGVTTTGGGNISGDLNVTGVTTVGKQVHVGTGVSIAAGGLNVTAGISTFQAVQGTTGAFSGVVQVTKGTSGGATANTDAALILDNSSHTYVQFRTPATKEQGLLFGDDADNDVGAIIYNHSGNHLGFKVNAAERARIDSAGLRVNKTSTSDYGKFEVKGGTADDIETADITAKTIATFSGSTPGTTAAGKGAGIVIKPIADRGCNYFFGVANGSTNQEATGDFIVRAGNLANSTVERFRIQSGGAFGINGENYGTSGQVLTSSGNNSAPTWTTITGTTINNNANNRIITGSGTANTLEAESGLTFDGTNLDLGANDKRIRLGASNQLYFEANSGGYGLFQNNTGVMYLLSNDFTFRDQATNDDLLKLIGEGAVELYHNNVKRFETTGSGITILGSDTTGSVVQGDFRFKNASATQHIVYDASASRMNFADNISATFGDANDMLLYHDGTTNYIKSDNGGIAMRVASGNRLEINGTSGDVIMQGSGGKNFTWDTSAAYLNLNDNARLTFGSSNDMYIWHDGTDSRIRSETGNLLVAVNEFKVTRTQDDSTAFSVDQDGGITLAHNHGARLSTLSGGVVMGSNYSEGTTEPFFVETGGTIRRRYSTTAGSGLHFTGGAIFPTTGPGSYSNGGITWGTGSYRWGQIFSVWTNISTSDRNLKNTITTSDLGLDFVNQLKPVSFKFNRATSDRTHYGLISQDVEDLLPKIGKTAMDFGGFCKDKNSRIETNADGSDSVIEEDGETYSLRYDEFIAPLIKAVQELSAKNDALEARIAALEGS